MNTNTHLIELERELEADLADARRHIELGRRNAIDQLNSHRESLGEHCGEAALKIDLLAADAERELKNVRTSPSSSLMNEFRPILPTMVSSAP